MLKGKVEGKEEGIERGFWLEFGVLLRRVVWPYCWFWSLSAIVGAPHLLSAVGVEVGACGAG